MSRNKLATPTWRIEIAVPGGCHTFYLDASEVAQFNADPDLYAAEMHDLTKVEYLQWIDLDGVPLCGHRTRGGDLCRNIIGPSQQKAAKWKTVHRKGRCAVHGRKRMSKKPA
jgi:hypothetical protein